MLENFKLYKDLSIFDTKKKWPKEFFRLSVELHITLHNQKSNFKTVHRVYAYCKMIQKFNVVSVFSKSNTPSSQLISKRVYH